MMYLLITPWALQVKHVKTKEDMFLLEQANVVEGVAIVYKMASDSCMFVGSPCATVVTALLGPWGG